MTIEHNAEACFLGLACRDALSRPVEFNSTEEIASQHGQVTSTTMVGESPVMCESLRRVAVRHPENEHEQWQASTAQSGVDA